MIIFLDFDGVIANYDQGFKGVGVFGEPLPNVKQTMDKLKGDGWKIIIFTARGELDLLKKYLDKNSNAFPILFLKVRLLPVGTFFSPPRESASMIDASKITDFGLSGFFLL